MTLRDDDIVIQREDDDDVLFACTDCLVFVNKTVKLLILVYRN